MTPCFGCRCWSRYLEGRERTHPGARRRRSREEIINEHIANQDM